MITVTANDAGGQPDFVMTRDKWLQGVDDRLARRTAIPILLVEEVEVNRASTQSLEDCRVIRASLDHQLR